MAFGDNRKPLKRTGWRQQSLEEVKAKQAVKRVSKAKLPKATKKRAKKAKRSSLRQLKDKLWREVKRITRESYEPNCYTCGTYVEGKNDHAGHGKPMGALPLTFKYDIRNIRRQCMVCNIHRGGMQDIFIAKLEQEEDGLQFLQEACYFDEGYKAWRIRQDTPTLGGKDATLFVLELTEKYKKL